jgi:hypothetical protein
MEKINRRDMELIYLLYFVYLFPRILEALGEQRPSPLVIFPYAYKKAFANRIEYYNREGQLHRTNGPAREYFNGSTVYIINGHRLSKEEFNKLYKEK